MSIIRVCLVFFIFNIISGSHTNLLPADMSLEKLQIKIYPYSSRPYVFTNKKTAFFYGESSMLIRDGHQGFYVMEKKYLDDYIIGIKNAPFKREDAEEINYFPHCLERKYTDNVTERLYLFNEINCLTIEIIAKKKQRLFFAPLLPDQFDLKKYTKKWDEKQRLLILAPKKEIASQKPNQPLKFVGIKFSEPVKFNREFEFDFDNNIVSTKQIGKFETYSNEIKIFYLIADTEPEILKLSQKAVENFHELVNDKKRHIRDILKRSSFETNQPKFDKAFAWALISMDQLIMQQPGANRDVTGIFAGLPWFNNYWGRDTFISYPGAVLTTGNFTEAREILLSFAQFQNQDKNSTYYGRIPNRVTVGDIIYNTTDGTPWFVKALWEYFLYTGDRDLLVELYPVVKMSIEGTLKNFCDQNYFLTHGDAETWMDARGGKGAWSPRGNRAVEIQALWFQQLKAAVNISSILKETEAAERWVIISQILKVNFQKKFWSVDSQALFDHLDADGNPDLKIRPNQIFALSVPEESLLSGKQELAVLKEVTTKLTYPYGVASLWQHDPDFHPYHQYPAYYPKDEAYHNGTVWCWLAGPVISSLIKYDYSDLAYTLLEEESDQILNRGAAGTFAELLDALPKPGNEKPDISGTISQAWSLAEYIRNVYQDVLGVRPDMMNKKIVFTPKLPGKIEFAKFKIPLKSEDIEVSIKDAKNQQPEICIDYLSGKRFIEFEIEYPLKLNRKIAFLATIEPGKRKEIKIKENGKINISIGGETGQFRIIPDSIQKNEKPVLAFAVPELAANLKCLQPPPYPLLTGEQITEQNSEAPLLYDETDAKFDDTGPTNKYIYPQSSSFKKGIFDLTNFQLSKDDRNYYFYLRFRKLVQPGWHPEYGFQLTFVGIAINQDEKKVGKREVGRNANYELPESYAYDKIIFIGGGIQIEDEKKSVIAAYRPSDTRFPIGDVKSGEIKFAVPISYLGNYNKDWKLAVLVGGQDDHGGAGLGEFRAVGKAASDWLGGGAENDEGNCNIYDFLFMSQL